MVSKLQILDAKEHKKKIARNLVQKVAWSPAQDQIQSDADLLWLGLIL